MQYAMFIFGVWLFLWGTFLQDDYTHQLILAVSGNVFLIGAILYNKLSIMESKYNDTDRNPT
jgi:hypothetical protein